MECFAFDRVTWVTISAVLPIVIAFPQIIYLFRFIPSRLVSPKPKSLTVRIDEIPICVGREKLQSDLEKIIKGASLDRPAQLLNITVRSLTPRNKDSASATAVILSNLSAERLTDQLWHAASSSGFPYTFTCRFERITPLYTSPSGAADVDIVAVTGLGGHAFGSWKAKGSDDMWLRDFVPLDFESSGTPNIRILLYGYDSTLQESISKQSIASIGSGLLEQIIAFREMDEALVQAHEESKESETYHHVSQACYGLLFFGVPNAGLRHEELSILVKGQRNENLIRELLTDEDGEPQSYLRTLRGQFRHCGQHRYHVVTFYECLQTSTVQIDKDGKARRTGPKRLQVSIDSACQTGLERQPPGIPLDTDHSGLVKFSSRSSGEYPIVFEQPRQLVMKAPASVSMRFDYGHPEYLKKVEYDCLHSLKFSGMGLRQDNIDRGSRGTCEWLFVHDSWRQWKTQPGGMLWIQGNPGSGKSTLMEYATRQFSKLYGSRTIVVSFFCSGHSSNELEKSPRGLFRSLLHQLLITFPQAFTDLTNHFALKKTTMGDDWEWHEQQLRDHIHVGLQVILKTAPVVLFLDALDEMGGNAAVRVSEHVRQFASDFAQQGFPFGFSVCISSRYFPVVDVEGDLTICMERGNSDDIVTFVETKLAGYLSADICALVTAKAQGIFLWVRLIADRLLRLHLDAESEPRIRYEIERMPQGLDEFYHSLIHGNDPLSEDDRRQLLSLVQCLCVSMRPLSQAQLPWAMAMLENYSAVTFDEHTQSMGYISQERVSARLLSLSRGLVEIKSLGKYNPDKAVAQFIHHSVKEYFVNKGLRSLSDMGVKTIAMTNNIPQTPPSIDYTEQTAHLKLAVACMCYLRLSARSFDLSRCTPSELPIFHKLQAVQPFLGYAARFWVEHLQSAKPTETHMEMILQALGCPTKPTIEYWCKLHTGRNMDLPWQRWSVESPPFLGSNLVHVLAVYGIDLLRCLLRWNKQEEFNGQVDSKNSNGRTPLAEAASWNSYRGVRILLDHYLDMGGVDVDSQDFSGQTPLSLAVTWGNEAVPIVQALLDTREVDVNSRDNQGRTPLWWAAATFCPSEEIIKILSCSSVVEPNLPDNEGNSPLCVATIRRNNANFRTLINDARANVDEVDRQGRPLLWLALHSSRGVMFSVEFASMLLDAGADANARDPENNRTLLGWALRIGYRELIQALMVKYQDRFNFDASDTQGLTPRSMIVEEGYRHIPIMPAWRDRADDDNDNHADHNRRVDYNEELRRLKSLVRPIVEIRDDAFTFVHLAVRDFLLGRGGLE